MSAGSGTALGRIIAAFELGAVKLRGFDALAAELLRPDTELALCVVLSVFAGVAVPGLGAVADSIAALKPAVNLGPAGGQLDSAIKGAATATQRSETARAAELLAQAMQAIGPERIGPLIRTPQFAQLRSYLVPMRADLLGDGRGDADGGEKAQGASPVAGAQRGSGAWWALGLVAGVGVALLVVGSAPKRKMTYGHG